MSHVCDVMHPQPPSSLTGTLLFCKTQCEVSTECTAYLGSFFLNLQSVYFLTVVGKGESVVLKVAALGQQDGLVSEYAVLRMA